MAFFASRSVLGGLSTFVGFFCQCVILLNLEGAFRAVSLCQALRVGGDLESPSSLTETSPGDQLSGAESCYPSGEKRPSGYPSGFGLGCEHEKTRLHCEESSLKRDEPGVKSGETRVSIHVGFGGSVLVSNVVLTAEQQQENIILSDVIAELVGAAEAAVSQPVGTTRMSHEGTTTRSNGKDDPSDGIEAKPSAGEPSAAAKLMVEPTEKSDDPVRAGMRRFEVTASLAGQQGCVGGPSMHLPWSHGLWSKPVKLLFEEFDVATGAATGADSAGSRHLVLQFIRVSEPYGMRFVTLTTGPLVMRLDESSMVHDDSRLYTVAKNIRGRPTGGRGEFNTWSNATSSTGMRPMDWQRRGITHCALVVGVENPYERSYRWLVRKFPIEELEKLSPGDLVEQYGGVTIYPSGFKMGGESDPYVIHFF